METVAVPAIKRANPDTTKTLSRAGVSTVHEAQGRMGLMKPYMRPFMLAAPAMLPINSKWNFRSSHAPFQNRRSKIQPRDDYLQKTGAAYAAALFCGSLLAGTCREMAI